MEVEKEAKKLLRFGEITIDVALFFSFFVIAGHFWGAFPKTFGVVIVFLLFYFLKVVCSVFFGENRLAKLLMVGSVSVFLYLLSVVVITSLLRELYFLITTPCKH